MNTFTILRDLYPENERPRNLANLAYLLDTIQKHPGLRDVGYCVEIGISIGTFKDLIRELKYKGLVTQKGYEFIDPPNLVVGPGTFDINTFLGITDPLLKDILVVVKDPLLGRDES